MENFKSEIMQTLSMKMDTLHIKRKQEEAESSLAISFTMCTKRHHRNEGPLNSIDVSSIYEEDRPTNKFPSLSKNKVVYQGAKGATEPLYFMNQRRPHGPRPYQQGMQGTSQAYYNPNQAISMTSRGLPTHPSWSKPTP